ncbi:hypothetical protein HID58_086926 [Brassica napus]|uniref:Uncharacterized protein n=1 Tax=Brassica napus TaxID=3708 RepID=A0ABQ7XRQ3_BRANA|nr:hypothetical protein HID58_086926 [Brassica napus]
MWIVWQLYGQVLSLVQLMSSLNSSVTMVDRFQRIYSHSSRFCRF